MNNNAVFGERSSSLIIFRASAHESTAHLARSLANP